MPEPENVLTYCTGSFGANLNNDLLAMIREFGEPIYFAHTRNTVFTGTRQFYDSSHAEGDLSILEVMKTFKDIEFAGPFRPDH